MNLADILSHRAKEAPDRIAIVEGGGASITFGDLDREVARGARRLAALGIRPGDPVLLLHPVSITLYAALLACFRLGAPAVLLDPSAGREFVAKACAMIRPRAFLGSPKAHLLRLTMPAIRAIPLQIATGWVPFAQRWQGDAGGERDAFSDADAPALITFTSGSTGKPKAAARTHRFLLAQDRALGKAIALQPGEIDLVTLPVFALANLSAGATTVIANTDLRRVGEPDSPAVAAQIAATGSYRAAASPAFFSALLRDHPDCLRPFKKLYTGGAPVFPQLLLDLAKAAPGAGVHAVYGSTEAEPIAHFSAADLDEATLDCIRNGAGLPAGQPVPEIDLAILPDRWGTPVAPLTDAEFAQIKLAPGAPGEICVAGDHVLPGYLGGQGDAETKFRAGDRTWHRTGDAGYLDRSGALWLLGRCAARLPAAGDAPRYPLAIEAALSFYPEIKRAAALGIADQRVIVLETSERSKDWQAALSHLRAHRIVILDQIPLDRRHQAKIDYPALRALLQVAPMREPGNDPDAR